VNYSYARKLKNDIVKWIQDWFEENGKGCKAVIGISGGKDSSIVAALCVQALGKERVLGVLMPNGEQSDIDVAHKLVKHLDIESVVINIKDAYAGVVNELEKHFDKFEGQAKVNLPPRLRMSVLYAVSQTVNGRVANTCNLSEDWVGYSTRWGDSVGDFSPLSNLTVQEVKAIGETLLLPEIFIEKTPADGLSGKTDEDNLGFSYEVLDKYIMTGICEDAEIKAKIDALHEKNLFKLQQMPSFKPGKEKKKGLVSTVYGFLPGLIAFLIGIIAGRYSDTPLLGCLIAATFGWGCGVALCVGIDKLINYIKGKKNGQIQTQQE